MQPQQIVEGAWTLDLQKFPKGYTVTYWRGERVRGETPPSTNCYPNPEDALARARDGIAYVEAGGPRQTATFTANIGGVEREVEVVEVSQGRQELWRTEQAIVLTRTPKGNRLWPSRLTFFRDRTGKAVMQREGYYILNACNGSVVAWNEEELGRLVSRHNGASTGTVVE